MATLHREPYPQPYNSSLHSNLRSNGCHELPTAFNHVLDDFNDSAHDDGQSMPQVVSEEKMVILVVFLACSLILVGRTHTTGQSQNALCCQNPQVNTGIMTKVQNLRSACVNISRLFKSTGSNTVLSSLKTSIIFVP